jgi:hypothetical protein
MRVRVGIVATVSVVLLTSGCVATADVGSERPEHPRVVKGERIDQAEPDEQAPERPARPSFVVVLMDDFSLDLLPTMRQAQVMAREGASYEHAYVVDSLCCVSRTSLLTGQYPHQTGVRTNTANTPNPVGPLGGFEERERPAAEGGLDDRPDRQVPQRVLPGRRGRAAARAAGVVELAAGLP